MTRPPHSVCLSARPLLGFSLAELLVTLAILAIGAALASATFSAVRAGVVMRTTAQSLVHALFAAHQRALASGHDTVICPSADGARCRPDGDWSAGWLIFENRDGDSPATVDADEPVILSAAAPRRLTMVANRDAFVMRAHGRRSTNGTFTLCGARGPRHARAVIVSYTGKPRLGRPRATGLTAACGVDG